MERLLRFFAERGLLQKEAVFGNSTPVLSEVQETKGTCFDGRFFTGSARSSAEYFVKEFCHVLFHDLSLPRGDAYPRQ